MAEIRQLVGIHLKQTLVTLQWQDERDAINMKFIELQMVATEHAIMKRIEGKDGWTPVPDWPQTFMKKSQTGKTIILLFM